MHYRRWLIASALVAPIAGWAPALPQDVAPMPRPTEETAAGLAAEDAAAVATENADDLLGEQELDDLVAPIALYPDALLAQILVAATFPLDVIKADRFIDENKDLSDKERTDKAETRGLGPEPRGAGRRLPDRGPEDGRRDRLDRAARRRDAGADRRRARRGAAAARRGRWRPGT